MKNPNNQNTLFRFISLRSPELSKTVNQEIRFIFHPYNKTIPSTPASFFYTEVKEKSSGVTNWQALVTGAGSFSSIQSVGEIETALNSYSSDFLYYTNWLAQNKVTLLATSDITKIKAIANMPADLELKLWDNLFYQIITQKSFYVKEMLMQALYCLQVVRWYKLNLTTSNSLLLNARVVLPINIFDTAQIDVDHPSTLKPINNLVPSKAIQSAKKMVEAKAAIENYDVAFKELKKIEKRYLKARSDAYLSAKSAHEAIVSPLIKQYKSDFMAAQKALCPIPKDKDYNPYVFCNLPDVAEPDLPDFTFSFEDELSYIGTHFSSENKAILEKLDGYDDAAGFKDLFELVEHESDENAKIISSKDIFSKRVAVIGDVVVPVIENTSKAFEFTFKICSTKNPRGRYNPYMMIHVPDESFDIAENGFAYTIKYSDGTETSDTSFIKEISQNVITLRNMFDVVHGFEIPLPLAISKIYGTITFTNGITKTFQALDFQIAENSCTTVNYLKDGDDPVSNPPITYIPKGFGYRQLGIADYRKVVSEICCYDAGEVAHIENIMASEYKEKTTEKNTVRETTLFESEETEKETLSDNTTAQRFEMQTEISKILAEQRQNDSHANVTASYSGATLDTGMSSANNSNKEESTRQAITQSKEITQRAMERIVSRIKNEKTVKITESFKDINSHIFDNRGGTEHVSGVYRFVNAIYKNQIYNYGKRVMYEFMVPEPSKLHRLALKESALLRVPVDPRANPNSSGNIRTYSYLTAANYIDLAVDNDAEVKPYPSPSIYLNKTFSGGAEIHAGNPPTGAQNTDTANLEIPEGYQTTHVAIKAVADHDNTGVLYNSFGVSVGNITIFDPGSYGNSTREINIDTEGLNQPPYILKNFSKSISLGYQSLNDVGFNISISIKCELTPEGLAKWQKETWTAIINGYEEKLHVYNETLEAQKAQGVQILESNPLFHRQIEQMVLRKNCISYLIDNTLNSPQRFGQEMYLNPNDFKTNQVNLTQNMDDYSSLVKFMEQAFEWSLISYNFYPYYWGSSANWADLYKYESSDATFRSFMQSGMARVVVTVKPGFEDAVMHYMAFKQIWNGGEMPVLGDPLYLSIVDELREPEYTIDEIWETVLPTNLVALQESAVALKGEGLPCSDDCKEAKANNPFSKGTKLLTPTKTTTTTGTPTTPTT